MRKFSSIDIYCPNLLTPKTCLQLSSAVNSGNTIDEYSVEFDGVTPFNIVRVTNGNIHTLIISDKNFEPIYENYDIKESSFSLEIPTISEDYIFIYFESSSKIKIESIELSGKLFNLGAAAADFTPSDYSKQGHFYVNSGSLLTWHEYKKTGGRLRLSNCTFEFRNKILNAFETYKTLTFHLNPDIDKHAVYQMTLIKAPYEKFDIKTGLFELELTLAQR